MENKKFNHFINGIHYGLSAYVDSENNINYLLDWATPKGKRKGQFGGGNLKTTQKQILEINKAMKKIEREYNCNKNYIEEKEKKQQLLSRYIVDEGIENIKYVVDYIHPFWKNKPFKICFITKRLADNFIKKLENADGADFIRLYTL